ncbi:uncharacterized protein LOC111351417 isoform X2 [Spodoptera litura]|uniref:Uncharacterized protein LOC111351417 isoform X2 n=1 Tax=Spodoptera litura TaxID=69820 RepID=A0A9J7E003_SPOLT|nr:uncharacterized protein LOC111351417 isoform X2 [Spodoptera litura]
MLTILFLFCLCTVVKLRECQDIQSKLILPCKGDEIIYDEYCGSDNEFAGQGGIDAEEDGFPHLAPLTYDKVFNESEFGCGSSVISEKFGLTVAPCNATSARVPVWYAVSGFLQRKDMYDIPEKNVRGVQKIIKHSEYKPYDIALLDLDKEATAVDLLTLEIA